MSDEERPQSRYEIFADTSPQPSHSILRRKSGGFQGSRGILEEFMPNVGSLANANFVVQQLNARDESSRVAAANREKDFQASLKVPHKFMQATSRVDICYCGKPTEDKIHIADNDEDQI